MVTNRLAPVVRRLRRAVLSGEAAERADAQLLERFVADRDEVAFEALVRRHGSMVFGVCRRLLRDRHDAEDAFQATFLVLVRKAASVAPRERVGNWLYGVAYQTAVRVRSANAKRRRRERQTADLPEPVVAPRDAWDDLRPVLDHELNRLPGRYRVAIILCDLEGKTRKAAARQAGCPEGTLSSRLTRGRALLARRLTRRGLGLSGALLGVVLSQKAAEAALPASVAASTIQAAGLTAGAAVVSARVAALMEGVLRSMLLTKIKTVLAVAFVIAALTLGGKAIVWSAVAAEGPPPPAPAHRAAADGDKDDARLKDTLIALAKYRAEAWGKGDVGVDERLLADDLIAVSGYGKFDKKHSIEGMKELRTADYAMRDAEVVRVSKDSAVLTYVYDCKVQSPGGELLQTRRDHRASLVWANREGHWVIVFIQETILPGGE